MLGTVFFISLAFLAFIPSAVSLQLDRRIAVWQAETGVRGISVAVQHCGLTETAVRGIRNEAGDMIAPDSRFALASVSKTLTAAAILVLVERGQFRLDDSVASASGLDFGHDITVADLLYHEAGLPEFIGGALSFETFLQEHNSGRELWAADDVLGFATAIPAHSSADFHYSNTHYALLGRIIEYQTGLALADALDQLVFQPAGLSTAVLIQQRDQAPDALGYSAMLSGALGAAWSDERLARELASLGYAAGGVIMSTEDLARWGRLWFSGEFVSGQSYRTPAGGSAIGLAADRLQVGAGAFEVRYGNRILRLHGGDGLGVTALLVYDATTDTSIAILQNDDATRSLGFGADGFLDSLALELIMESTDC